MVNNWNNQFIYLKLLKWNFEQDMKLLLGASKVSLRIFFKQFLIFMNISNLYTTQQQTNSYQQYWGVALSTMLNVSSYLYCLPIPMIKDIAKTEYANSRRIAEELALSINNQDLSYNVDTSNIKSIKDKIKCEKELLFERKLDEIVENLNIKQKRLNRMAREKGV